VDVIPTIQGTFENVIGSILALIILSTYGLAKGKVKAKSEKWLAELKKDSGLRFRTFARSIVWFFVSITLTVMSMALLLISRIDFARSMIDGSIGNSGTDWNYWASLGGSVSAGVSMAFGLYLLASVSMATISDGKNPTEPGAQAEASRSR